MRDVTTFVSWSTAQLEGADEATETFLKIAHLGNDPALGSRTPDCPVGLKVRYGPFTYHSGINWVDFRTLGPLVMPMHPFKYNCSLCVWLS